MAVARACIRGGARGRFYTVVDLVRSFLVAYVEPYVVLMVLLVSSLWAGFRIAGRRDLGTAKRAIATEVRLNIRMCSSVIGYAEDQKVGHPYIIPIPRFYTTAYDNLRSRGLLFELRKELSDELVFIYETIERVHAACDRQEELAVGVAATSPIAPDLRSESLAFIRDSVKNTIKPRLEMINARHKGKL
jgi:hypothetical protein